MPSKTILGLSGMILLAGVLATGLLAAQTRPKQGECLPDEIDMGDYCASLPPAMTGEEKDRRRVTRFRGSSMMPGKKSMKSAPASAPLAPVQPPTEVVPLEAYVVQLGAFSTRELAESVALSVESPGPPMHVVPLNRGDRVLWACVQGPFPEHDSAVIARDYIRGNRKFHSAYVKLLDHELEQGMAHDSTEK